MKIVFFSHDAGLYGATRSMIDLILGLKAKGVSELLFIPTHGEIEENLKKNKINYEIIPYKPWTKGDNKYKILFYHARYLKFKIEKLLLNLKTCLRLKKRFKNQEIDFIYTNTSTIPVGIWLSKLLNIRHLWHIREFGQDDHGFKFDFGKKVFSRWLKKSYKVIYISNSLKSYYDRNYTKSNSLVIYNGVYSIEELNVIRTNKKEKDNSDLVFLMLGQIKESKGQLIAIKAFKKVHLEFPNIRLIIVGSGDDKDINKIREEIKVEPNIQLKPFTNCVEDYYNLSDIYLMCSKKEAFGRVTIEAMAHGLAIIGNNRGATKEIIKHKINGVLYNETIEELINSMKMLLTHAHLIDKLSKKGQEDILHNFSKDNYINDFYKLLGN